MGRKIKRVVIDNLIYGVADFVKDINPRLQIFTGPNGSGKTTILNTINSLVNDHTFKPWAPMNSISVIFDNDAEIVWDGIKVERHGDLEDIRLVEVGEDYHDVADKIENYIEDIILSGRKDVIDFLEECLEMYNIKGNNLLEKLKSEIERKTDKIKIPAKGLSLGEMILFRLFANLPSGGIYLLDTPEISIHLCIQNILLDKLLDLEPDTQFIIATHSPSLIGKHWNDSVIDLYENEREYTTGNKQLLSPGKSNTTEDS